MSKERGEILKLTEIIFVSTMLALIALGFLGAYQIHFEVLMPVEDFESALGIPWRTLVALYVFLVLIGTAAIASAAEILHIRELESVVKDAIVIGILVIAVGLFTIAVDLERVERGAYALLGHANPMSVMYWMIMFYVLEVVFLIFEGWFYFRADLLAQSKLKNFKGFVGKLLSLRFIGDYLLKIEIVESSKLRRLGKFLVTPNRELDLNFAKPIGFVALITAILAYSNLGALFAVTYIPLWHDATTPIYFIISAIIGGSAVLIFASVITSWVTGSSEKLSALRVLKNLLALSLIVAILFNAWKFIVSGYPAVNEQATSSINNLLFGAHALNYWILELLVGLLIPLILLLIAGNKIKLLFASATLTILGLFVFRINFVFSGQFMKNISGISIPTQIHPFEAMFVAGALALAIFAYYLVYKFLPMGVKHEA